MEVVGVAKRFEKLGYKIYATRSTAKYLQEHGVNALRVNKISQESPNVMDLILGHKIDLVIDTPTQGNGDKSRDGFLIRRNAIETLNYIFYYQENSTADRDILKIAQIQQSCYEYICSVLKTTPTFKIEYFLCETAEDVGRDLS